MADQKQVVYECEVCETEIIINNKGGIELNPVYCCGSPVHVKKTIKKNAKKSALKTKAAAKPKANKSDKSKK